MGCLGKKASPLKKQAERLDPHYPGSGASLRKVWERTLYYPPGIVPGPAPLLGTTNVIESPHAGVRLRTNPVSRWQDGKIVLRWVVTVFLKDRKEFPSHLGLG